MIHADLRGKTHVPEDVLTSNCLGLLRLLPDRDCIAFLGMAQALNGLQIDLSLYERVGKIDFWPWLPEGGEPDVLIELQKKDGGEGLVLIIEAKHGAGLSSDDQLARYWCAASRRFNHTALIYLTHDRSLPKDVMTASLCKAGSEAAIFWLSWFALYRWVTDRLVEISPLPTPERRILEALRGYLSAKGYRCFLGWPPFPSARDGWFTYRRVYCFHATGNVPENYVPTYKIDRQITPIQPLCFYQVRREDA